MVTSLAWNGPDTLYSAGYDKVVNVWQRQSQSGKFVVKPNATYRVPVGPGQAGAINAISVSSDGRWLATGGLGIFRQQAGFRDAGFVVPASELTDEMQLDRGTIHIFDVKTHRVTYLRGHRGAVTTLAFAPLLDGSPPLLASCAYEIEANTRKEVGCVRVWDMSTGRQIEERRFLLDRERKIRPTLCVRRQTAKPEMVEIAVAGLQNGIALFVVGVDGESSFRMGQAVCNGAIAFVPGEESLIVGFNDLLQKWSLDAIRRNIATPLAQYHFETDHALPMTIATASSDRTGAATHLVCVSWVTNQAFANRLSVHSLSDLTPAGNAKVLWPFNSKVPTLACVSGSGRFAVCGGPNHSVSVYELGDFLMNGTVANDLNGIGIGFVAADFVRRENDIGLRLTAAENLARGNASAKVINFNQRSLNEISEQWRPDNADAGWQAKPPRQQLIDGEVSALFDFTDMANRTVTIRIPGVEEFRGGSAVLPTSADHRGLIALGFRRETEPILGIFDLETGAELRHFTGHTQAPRHLRFSKDGRFLVSCADDQTVCVWSLTDLDAVAGTRGRPIGLEVVERGGQIVVVKANPTEGGFTAGMWMPGDIIAELNDGVRRVQPKSNLDYYDVVTRRVPGSKVRATRIRPNEPPAAAEITIGQGIDEQKPLFSLFFGANGSLDSPWMWIGWSPMGPYDCSGPEAEYRLGWHFNNKDSASPTSFADVQQLRKEFRRPGLLQNLIRDGNWKPEIAAPPPPPTLTIWLKDDTKRNLQFIDAEWPRLRSNNGTLHLAIGEFPAELIAGATCVFDGGAALPMQASSESQWTASLTPMRRTRGRHEISVKVLTAETPPREFVARGMIEYRPLAPRIELPGIDGQVVVDSDNYSLPIRITASASDVGPTVLMVTQKSGSQAVAEHRQELVAAVGGKLTVVPLKLAKGPNSLSIRAINKDAEVEKTDDETSTIELSIINNRKPQRPPKITILEIHDRQGVGAWFSGKSGQASPKFTDKAIRVVGKVESTESLAEAAMGIEELKPMMPPAGKPTKVLEFAETVDLKFGPQTLIVKARSETSEWSETRLDVEYQPPTPVAEIAKPLSGSVYVKDRDQGSVRVVGRFDSKSPWAPFEAKLLRDGVELDAKVKVDLAAGALTADSVLVPGEQSFQFQTENRWGQSTKSLPISVRLARPPKLMSIQAPSQTDKPMVEISVKVQSELPGLTLTVNGKAVPVTNVTRDDSTAGIANLSLRNIALAPGVNRLEVSASNSDGTAAESKSATVEFAPPIEKPAAPKVEFVDPAVDGVAASAACKIRFRVQSRGSVRFVRLTQKNLRGEKTVFQIETPKSAANAAAGILSTDVVLTQGVNRFELVAGNDGGESRVQVALTGAFSPTRIVIDRLELNGNPDQILPFEVDDKNQIRVAKSAVDARIRLRGRVLWNDPTDNRIDRPCAIHLWVNGMQQLPAYAENRDANRYERRFSADLLLHQEKNNRVRLAVSGLAVDKSSPMDFVLDCEKPITNRDVHLVGIAPFAEDGRQLKARLLKAVNAREPDHRTCAFGRLRRVDVFAGEEALLKRVQFLLGEIQQELISTGESNVIVLIYYEGEERARGGDQTASDDLESGFRLLTHESKNNDNPKLTSISDKDLAHRFAFIPGAHVLLLDVARKVDVNADARAERLPASNWPRNSEVAMLRLARGQSNPANDRLKLLTMLSSALPAIGRFEELGNQIAVQIQALVGANRAGISYDPYIPDDLRSLVVRLRQ